MAMPEKHRRELAETAVETIERQDWLDAIAERLQAAVAAAFSAGGDAGRRVRDALHGTWFGHPLHPALTAVPLGAWTTAALLDSMNDRRGRLSPAADTAITIGIAGAVGAAATGITDWHHTTGDDRRVGLTHGLLNTAALALYVTSLVLRRRGERDTARLVSGLGLLVASGAGYLGGHLVFRRRLGVDHAPRPGAWDDFVDVLDNQELQEGKPHRVEARGVPLVLVRRGTEIHALADQCAHLGGPLSEGSLEDCAIRCPWHGSKFSLETGEVIEGPSTFAQPCFDVRVRGDRIEVRSRG